MFYRVIGEFRSRIHKAAAAGDKQREALRKAPPGALYVLHLQKSPVHVVCVQGSRRTKQLSAYTNSPQHIRMQEIMQRQSLHARSLLRRRH